MKVLAVKLLKNKTIFIGIIGILISNITYAEYTIIYGLKAADIYKNKHPNSTYIIQVASFSKERNALSYQKKLQVTNKHPITIKPKFIHNKKMYAVMIGPIKPSNKLTIFPKTKLNTNIQVKKINSTKNVTSQKSHVIIYNPIKFIEKQDIKNLWINSNWYLTIGGGEQFPNSSSTLTVNNGSGFPSPYDVDIYSGSSRNNSGIFALSGGRVWQRNSFYIPSYSLGVMWQHLFRNNLNGQITQYSDPEFLNYDYQLNTTSNVVLAYSKINIFSYKKFLPYFNIGLGGTFNRTNGYNEEALEFVTARVSPQFQDNSSNQFAYLLGAGFDVLATPNLSISAGYNYLNIGNLATGYGVETWSAAKLNYGANSTNEVLITLNYKFNKNRIFP